MFTQLREDFPVLREDDAPAYLDNACVTLKPQSVIDVVTQYYTETPGCGGRSVHRFGTTISKSVHDARVALSQFINAPSPKETIFTPICAGLTFAITSPSAPFSGAPWNKPVRPERSEPAKRALAAGELCVSAVNERACRGFEARNPHRPTDEIHARVAAKARSIHFLCPCSLRLLCAFSLEFFKILVIRFL